MSPHTVTDLDMTLRVTAGARAWLRRDSVALCVLVADLEPEIADAFLSVFARVAEYGAAVRGPVHWDRLLAQYGRCAVFAVYGVDIGGGECG